MNSISTGFFYLYFCSIWKLATGEYTGAIECRIVLGIRPS